MAIHESHLWPNRNRAEHVWLHPIGQVKRHKRTLTTEIALDGRSDPRLTKHLSLIHI